MRPLGLGNAVDKGTFYNPWLATVSWNLRPGTCGDEVACPYQHMRIYGSDSLMLQAGWNSLSVPMPLHTGYDTLATIRSLGTFLEDDMAEKKYEVAFEYLNTTGGWDTDPEFQAVHGYFIKMKEPTRFPVIYGEAPFMLASYSLTSDDPSNLNVNGWNLIGSAFGIDRADDGGTDEPDQARWAVADPDDPTEGEAHKPADVVLHSIIGDGGKDGLSVLVNPHVTGQLDKDWFFWEPGAAPIPEMYTGQAYWAYMTEAGALNGFENAPLFFEGDPPLPLR
jgi:hypothetical protein